MSTATAPLKLTRQQAIEITGTRTGGDFLMNALICTQSKTAQKRGGGFWKSYREWGESAGVSRTTVNRYTQQLVSEGILTTWKEVDYSTLVGGVRTWYKVNVDKLAVMTGAAVQKVALKAIEMKKAFTGEPVVKPMATPVEHPEPRALFTADDFTQCNGFIVGFSAVIERFARESRKDRLVTQFRHFGFQSSYVKTCFDQYLASWQQWASDDNKRDCFEQDFQQLEEGGWQDALQVRAGVINP